MENPTGEFCGKARSSWGSMHHRRDSRYNQRARLADAGLEEGKSTAMVNNRRTQTVPVLRSSTAMQPPCGSVRPCAPYRGELARHRLITADGHDYVVATTRAQGAQRDYITAAYPVSRGYLVMMRQPLCELDRKSVV